ncbi:hypothetical protein GCK72_016766 [Caenorhabditis remanei]|uniref:Sdz-33 F-box domain-containing protein n=1 Tax=Caenorhabditis remanei TaxID=31234 RepID=A0A6A5G6W2_CAERE|nr:hypothetical protein GCK72_016766 [Caenorhabditis remanei]KAF1750219.1 hypothetical protein GCK72_016766 [Caenorhabditis remanei]
MLAIKEVLSEVTPLDLIHFSMVSLKTRLIARHFSKQPPISKYDLILVINEPLGVQIFHGEVLYEYEILSYKTENLGRLREENEIMKYTKYSEDKVTEFKKYVEYAMEVFNWPVDQLYIDFDDLKDQNHSIIDWLKFRVRSTKHCSLFGNRVSDDYVSYFLENVQVHRHLHLGSTMSDNFQLKVPKIIEDLKICKSNFITFDQLSSFNCVSIHLSQTSISNKELNQFFKNWMTSKSNQNLQDLFIGIKDLESLETIFKLPHEVIDPGTVRTLYRGNHPIPVAGGIDIKRDDGTVATCYTQVCIGSLYLAMLVHLNF